MVAVAAAQETAPDVLSAAHREELEVRCGVHRSVIDERDYRTVRADELPAGIPDEQRRDGMLVPIWSVWGTAVGMQIRPDTPRVRDGRPVLYETVQGVACLDVPRRLVPYLGDPNEPLWITEGATRVDAAASLGLRAVIGLQGPDGWRGPNERGEMTPLPGALPVALPDALPDWEAVALNGRAVVLAFDRDCMTSAKTRGAIEGLVRFLTRRGAQVLYCILPVTASALDTYLAQRKGYDDLFDRNVETLPPVEPAGERAVEPADASSDELEDELEVVLVSDIVAQEIEWIWERWIPRRMLTILGGYGGDGKSTMVASLIGALTTGGRMPDGETAPVMNVLMLSAEDDPSYAIRPRLEVHGADVGRVLMLKGTTTRNGRKRWLDMRRDAELMERAIIAHDIGLVVVDPLSSYLPSSDRNSEGDIRDALQPLMGLMERTGVAVVAIMHVGKSNDGRRVSQRLLGSTAFTAVARSVIMLADLPDEEQPGDATERGKLKVAQVVKSNYAIAPAPRLFRRPVDAAIEWMGESAFSVEDCYAGTKVGSRGAVPVARAEGEALLREMLRGGSVPMTEIVMEAKAVGIGEMTMRRAKQALGVESVKVGYPGVWHWRLPNGPGRVMEDGVRPEDGEGDLVED